MGDLATLTELLHLAHARPSRLRLELTWWRHWGRLKVMGDAWQKQGYGARVYLQGGETVDETVQPQEETGQRTLSWVRREVYRVDDRDEHGALQRFNLVTPERGLVFPVNGNEAWEHDPNPFRPNPVDGDAFNEPLLEPAFLLSAFVLEPTGQGEGAGRPVYLARALPRGERGFIGPTGFDFFEVADGIDVAVDVELGILLRYEVFFLGEPVTRVEVTKLEHPASFAPDLATPELPAGTRVRYDL